MTNEILREVTCLENIEEATGKHVPGRVHRVEAKRSQQSTLNNIKEAKDFDAIWQNSEK